MSYNSLESKIESLCEQILKTDSENWDAKNRAVLQITELVLEFDGRTPSDINDAFTPNLFRILKEPIKILVRILFGYTFIPFNIIVHIDIRLEVSTSSRCLYLTDSLK